MTRQDDERLVEDALVEDPATAYELIVRTRLRPWRLFIVLDGLVERGRITKTKAARESIYARAEKP